MGKYTLLIMPINEEVASLYKDAKFFYDGDVGFDIYCPDDVIIPGGTTGFVVPLGIKCVMQHLSNWNYSNDPVNAIEIDGKYFVNNHIERIQKDIGCELLLRSSTAKKTKLRLSNHVGVIDPGYRGEISALIDNIGSDVVINKGDRLFQIAAGSKKSFNFEIVKELPSSDRGNNGIGSSGSGNSK